MEFLQVVGNRRSIRWFKPWKPVERSAIQRILEAARLTSCPGNLQPWRAVVVTAAGLDIGVRDRLLTANNHQAPQTQAPVWIYWYADPLAATPAAFLERILEQLPTGAIAPSVGWTEQTARAAIEDGVEAPAGLPALESTVHGLPLEISALIAAQETNGACIVAVLAAVNEGLGTCLHAIAAPATQAEVKELLGVPEHLVPVWLQLVGHPAESPDGGGQRPRMPFDELYAEMRWGTPFGRDPAIVEDLVQEGLIQPAGPLPGRFEELEHLSRMFGNPSPKTERLK
jgi:nitroreductase